MLVGQVKSAPIKYRKFDKSVKTSPVDCDIQVFEGREMGKVLHGAIHVGQPVEKRLGVGDWVVVREDQDSGRVQAWKIKKASDPCYLLHCDWAAANDVPPTPLDASADLFCSGDEKSSSEDESPKTKRSTSPVFDHKYPQLKCTATSSAEVVQQAALSAEEHATLVEAMMPTAPALEGEPPASSMPPRARATPKEKGKMRVKDGDSDLLGDSSPDSLHDGVDIIVDDSDSSASSSHGDTADPDASLPPADLLGDYLKAAQPSTRVEVAAQVLLGRTLTDERESIVKSVFGSFSSVDAARVALVPCPVVDNRPLSWRGVKRVEASFEIRALWSKPHISWFTFAMTCLVLVVPLLVDFVLPPLFGWTFVWGVDPVSLPWDPKQPLAATSVFLAECFISLWPAFVCSVFSTAAATFSLWAAKKVLKPDESMHPFFIWTFPVLAAIFAVRFVPYIGVFLPYPITAFYLLLSLIPLFGRRWMVYAPHLVTCLLTEYARGTSVEIMRATLHAKALRLAAFPLPDRFEMNGVRITATDVLLGTEEVVMFMMQHRYFGSCPPDPHPFGVLDDGH
jgi:hypothetical protein